MRANEYTLRRLDALTVEFSVSELHFYDELEALELPDNKFIAKLGYQPYRVLHVQHVSTGRVLDIADYFDLGETFNDIMFAAMNQPQQFYGGER